MNVDTGSLAVLNTIDCTSINSCIGADLFNVGQSSFFGFLHNLFYYTFGSINESVIDWSVALLFFMLFLSFVVGFIFFVKR